MHEVIVNTLEGYVMDYLDIDTGDELYVITIYVNEDLIGKTSDHHSSKLAVFPNPSSANIKFEFTDEVYKKAILNISDQTGKIIRTFKLDGKSSLTWDGKNESNQQVKAGTYFYQLISDEILETGKVIVIE